MKNMMKATACAACCFTVSAVQADEALPINSLMFDTYKMGGVDRSYWKEHAQRADLIVKGGEVLATQVTEYLNDRFEFTDTPGGRNIFLITAGLLNFQVQAGHALYFGHEFAHFAFHDFYGYDTHYFYDVADRRHVNSREAYLRTLFLGSPGASAFNESSDGSPLTAAANGSIQHIASGLNWQMDYSEQWVRDHLSGGSVFSNPGYLANRFKMMAYALGDEMRGSDVTVQGDVTKIAQHYTDLGYDVSESDIAIVGAASMLLSPMTWNSFTAYSQYTHDGTTDMESLSSNAMKNVFGNSFQATWDLPAYLNDNSITMIPTFYTRKNGVTLGLGVETAVYGEDDLELNISAAYEGDGWMVEGLTALSEGGGAFWKVGGSIDLSEKLALRVDHVNSDGSTLRGARRTPYGEAITYAGFEVSF